MRYKNHLLAAGLGLAIAAGLAVRVVSARAAARPPGPTRVYRLIDPSGATVLSLRLEGDRLVEAAIPAPMPNPHPPAVHVGRGPSGKYHLIAPRAMRWDVRDGDGRD